MFLIGAVSSIKTLSDLCSRGRAIFDNAGGLCRPGVRLDWLYFEMDGSFVWAVREGEESVGQIDGMIYDRDDAIEYLDLKGNAPAIRGKSCLRCWWKPIAARTRCFKNF